MNRINSFFIRCIVIIFLIGISISGQQAFAQNRIAFRAQTQQELFNNTVFVVFDIGQSNSIGRATSARLVTILGESSSPTDVSVYYKSDYTTTDNGTFQQLVEGSANTQEPTGATSGATGAYGMVGRRIADVSPNPVYVIAAGKGSTALKQGLTTPDWAPASFGGMFEVSTQRYYKVAYDKIVAANPGKTIRVAICWHQGEQDALDATATSQYSTNFPAFVTSLRAVHASLVNAPLIITKLYFNISANEATINTFFDSYATSNSTLVKIVDISAYPRKMDLTTAQKGGIATAGSDDQHTSYLGMQAKAIQTYQYIHDYYFSFIP